MGPNQKPQNLALPLTTTKWSTYDPRPIAVDHLRDQFGNIEPC